MQLRRRHSLAKNSDLCYSPYRQIRATLAQSVEQPLRKRPVSGPSPEGGFIPQPALLGFLFS